MAAWTAPLDCSPRAASAPCVDEARPGDGPAWDAYVEGKPDATLYNLFGWKTVAEDAYGMRAPFLVARDTPRGAVRGVLPLVRVPRPFQPYLTTGLFGSYAPLLADEERHARALLSEAKRRVDAGEAKHLHLKLLGDVPAVAGLERREVWVTARADLARDEEAQWRALPRKQRWAVRHAERAGLGRSRLAADLDGFYSVLFENMHRKGAPIYGERFFRTALRVFGERADVITLAHENRTVSGAFVVSFGKTVYVPFASSLPGFFRQRVNHLLYWEIMKRGIVLGCDTLDFGSSLRDSTGLDFKSEWEARIEPILSYVYAADGRSPTLDPRESRVAEWVVRAWAKIPRRQAMTLGPALCRWIA
jgi:FemAB-related protein (PEP-CTERM system-associated)